jgi:hypothetical protein
MLTFYSTKRNKCSKLHALDFESFMWEPSLKQSYLISWYSIVSSHSPKVTMASCLKSFSVSENVDFNDFIRVSKFLFSIAMFKFDPMIDGASFNQKFVYIARQFYYKFVVFSFIPACASLVAYAVGNSDNFIVAASSLLNAVTVSLIVTKAFTTNARKDEIWNIFLELTTLFERRVDHNEKYKVRKYLRDFHRAVKIYGGIFFMTFIPIVVSIIPFILSGTMKLTVNYWYPFDHCKPHTFLLAFAWVNWIAINCLVSLLATDSLLTA